jgi:hypothetical protein
MKVIRYTSDEICQAVGLPEFVDREWSIGTLRVLLRPSFHPEVCITVSRPNEISVAAAGEMVRRQSVTGTVASYRESMVVSDAFISGLEEKYKSAVKAHQNPEGRVVRLDGMSIHCVYEHEAGLLEFKDHPYREESKSFVRELLQIVWDATVQVGVKNRLADCARYVSLTLPKFEASPQPPLYRVAVIGGPDERAEVLDDIERQVH